jgi:hypothetical protein
MSADELATDELKQKRARMEEKATRKRTRGAMVGGKMYNCPMLLLLLALLGERLFSENARTFCVARRAASPQG